MARAAYQTGDSGQDGKSDGKKIRLAGAVLRLMLTKASGITIPLRTVHAETLDGLLALPTETETLVILAQANKSRQQALINKWVSTALNRKGIGTLLLD